MPRRLASILLLLLAGCDAPTPSEVVSVAAASDLQAVLPVLEERFHEEQGLALRVTIGSSGQFAQQIEQGAPFDLFLSANRGFVRGLADKGLIRPDSVRDYARGSLVLVVHRQADPDAAIAGLDDLRRPEVKRIAIANPETAPYGRAAKQALERAGLWEELGPKVVQAESVRQALQFVQTGNAEAGLVGKAIADVPEVRAVPVDPSLHDPLNQALGITTEAREPSKAEAFAAFLLSKTGQSILARYGFRPPSQTEESP